MQGIYIPLLVICDDIAGNYVILVLPFEQGNSGGLLFGCVLLIEVLQ